MQPARCAASSAGTCPGRSGRDLREALRAEATLGVEERGRHVRRHPPPRNILRGMNFEETAVRLWKRLEREEKIAAAGRFFAEPAAGGLRQRARRHHQGAPPAAAGGALDVSGGAGPRPGLRARSRRAGGGRAARRPPSRRAARDAAASSSTRSACRTRTASSRTRRTRPPWTTAQLRAGAGRPEGAVHARTRSAPT